jgi:hypothetical protein
MIIRTTDIFEKSFKKLFKKDKHLIKSLEELINHLKENPSLGVKLTDNRYKIRLKNSSNNKGKSAGYRVITYTKIKDTIILVYIYSKSDLENISEKKIDEIIKNYLEES